MSNEISDTKAMYLDVMRATIEARSVRARSRLRELRQAAMASFDLHGFPTTRDEDWKYTDVRPIERGAFMPAPLNSTGALPPIESLQIDEPGSHRLVFVDGRLSETLSQIGRLPAGATICGLAAALRDQPDVLEAHLGRCAPADSGFAALNTALFVDGALIHLALGVTIDHPIHILYLTTSGASLVQPRTLVIAERQSCATIVEHSTAVSDLTYFANNLTEILAEDEAVIEHYRVQEESASAFHLSGLYAHLGRSSRLTTHAMDLGGRLVRNDLHVVLSGSGGECQLNGLYLAGDRQHIDNHTHIDHACPQCTSKEFYRGVLNGRGRSVFRGRIVVRPDAQKTDARQVNNNLLLSRDAEVDSQPQLEIYADDVKCSHGATVGQLDPDALFYLRSRALDERAARQLLTYAFAREVLGRIKLAGVRARVERRLAAGIGRPDGQAVPA